ncbi:MAG: 1-deoxy-D-xylulose-5-phosphate synthase [Deltaproteobacteria bacterium ADurb.Bin151]|jgi:1-deoxy-D-xylulose-5-phosphate synthase|nr:1-deoxy-D-xylulose-5-phosphate synthase [Smithella sp.]OQB55939.1 MAG: 1-deoxy-D-xylulose-5-phosphate synthase [Deltaproteobacteria bacterium ADurb.Bin151]HNZ10728.1 1-deoxy-D-xylulose-5-phosphate synthase [Smithellaceae bacterium]HOG81570.1 1-deoxy-D-xylulose-5-phosphate synthase [Smithellaceae bacterium]HQP23828.1 1-deoxy-D-xylulose-5-phosphate synthase [Smithellaceae bacterium]
MKPLETVDYSILPNINDPSDIRSLNVAELNTLAQEIRNLIIHTVASTGGHLASSLGTVELTLAIHYVFNTPQDKLIWDVGHQAYAHKIITGRKNRFSTLRCRGGISGFPKREESIYDSFNVGHSGTSIAAAAAFAEAEYLRGGKKKSIAVIGDGSMTTGMAFEGLNWSGDRDKGLIIILNDNEMSISPNVGAMSSYLNRVMTGDRVTRFKGELKNFLRSIPSVGEQIVKISRQIEESVKTFVVPGALFEELGFTYVGPLEGHRLDYLIKNFENVKKLEGPVLVHVITQKGRGYKFAEDNSPTYHGVAPFDVETGLAVSSASAIPSYTQIFGKTLIDLAESDSRIVAVTAAMCEGTGLDEFRKRFPERLFDVGIAEQLAVTFAAGLSVGGLLPVVAIYSTFLQRAYDQILHDVCLQKLPVVFAIDRAGIVGEDGATHQGLFDFSYLRNLPHLIMMAPKDENELRHMLKTAVGCGSPVSIRYPRGKGVGVPLNDELSVLPLGRGEVLQEGSDLAIIAVGCTVHPALAAGRKLEAEGFGVRVINARFIKPLDAELILETAASTHKLLTVEENVLDGGFGSAILELLAREGMTSVTVRRLGIRDEFVEHATQAELRSLHGLDEEGIFRAAKEMLLLNDSVKHHG